MHLGGDLFAVFLLGVHLFSWICFFHQIWRAFSHNLFKCFSCLLVSSLCICCCTWCFSEFSEVLFLFLPFLPSQIAWSLLIFVDSFFRQLVSTIELFSEFFNFSYCTCPLWFAFSPFFYNFFLFAHILYLMSYCHHTFLHFIKPGFLLFSDIFIISALNSFSDIYNVWKPPKFSFVGFSPCVWYILSCFFVHLMVFCCCWILNILDNLATVNIDSSFPSFLFLFPVSFLEIKIKTLRLYLMSILKVKVSVIKVLTLRKIQFVCLVVSSFCLGSELFVNKWSFHINEVSSHRNFPNAKAFVFNMNFIFLFLL